MHSLLQQRSAGFTVREVHNHNLLVGSCLEEVGSWWEGGDPSERGQLFGELLQIGFRVPTNKVLGEESGMVVVENVAESTPVLEA